MRKRNTTRNNNTVPGFLSKTYKILENPEYAEIISWNEDGKAFKVKKPNEFAEKVLPKYFKTNNFASFVRQLNMYDFHKLRHDSEENEWRHRLFRRGYPNLLCEIKRKINETQLQDAVVTQKEQKKITSDTQYLLKEMVTLKQKQESLEKACSVLIAQNTQILGENKLLWGEINKKKEKSQKKIEKLLSLVLNYIGPKQIPELAFLNGKKPNELLQSDYLKQEDLSDNETEDHHNEIISGGNRNNYGNSQKWDADIGNSINVYQFGNGNNNDNGLNNSFNGRLNASNLLNSQNGTNQFQIASNDNGEQYAQKVLDRLMNNFKNKNQNKANPQGMDPQNSQFKSCIDNFHKSNQDLLQSLTNFMNSHGGTQDISSIELNNQINQATMNPSGPSDLLQKRRMMSNPFSPNMSIAGIGPEELENVNQSLMSKKKIKKDDEQMDGQYFNNMNQNMFQNNFALESFLNNQLGGSNVFNQFKDINGGASINNKTSLDISKLFNNNDLQPLALPHSTTNQASSPIRNKKGRNSISNNIVVNNGNNNNSLINNNMNTNKSLNNNIPNNNNMNLDDQGGNKSISQMRVNDSLQFNPNVNLNASTLYNNPHQQSSQWDEFHKFLAEQKIEESLNNTQSNNTNNSTHLNSNGNINNNNNNGNQNNQNIMDHNDEFLEKDSVNKLNESMI